MSVAREASSGSLDRAWSLLIASNPAVVRCRLTRVREAVHDWVDRAADAIEVLVAEVPVVLRSELYAIAALVGASVVVVGRMLQLPSDATAVVGAALCFGLRVIAMQRGWRLPIAGERSVDRSAVHSAPKR